jgi:hypothetical protein
MIILSPVWTLELLESQEVAAVDSGTWRDYLAMALDRSSGDIFSIAYRSAVRAIMCLRSITKLNTPAGAPRLLP